MKGSFSGRPRAIDPDTASPGTAASGDDALSGAGAARPSKPTWFLFGTAKLRTRLIVAMVGLVVITVIAVGVTGYRSIASVLLHSEISRLESDVHALAVTLDAKVRDAREDVLAMRNANTVQAVVRSFGTRDGVDPKTGDLLVDWKSRVATLMISQLQAKPDYLQMRLIGMADGGREIVRVDRNEPGGSIHVVPEADLQQKGNHSYFTQTIALADGSVYISPINLNREHGKVQVPHTPVLRAATPIFTEDGKLFGIVIINVAMQPILDQLRSAARPGGDVYLVNDQGDFLLHPDRAKEFGFDLGRRYRVADEFPTLASLVTTEDSRSRITRERTGAQVGAAIDSIQLAGGPRVAVLEALPMAVLNAPIVELRWSVLATAVAGVLFAALLAVLIGRSLANPVEQMTGAIAALKQQKPVTLPTSAAGEIGELARAFENYVEQDRLYRLALQSAYDAMYTYTLDGVVTSWNPGAERLYGYSAEEMVGQPIQRLVPEELESERSAFVSRLCRNEPVPSMDTARLTKSGRKVEVSLVPSLARGPAGEPIGISVIARDVTEHREAEKRFRLAVESSPTGMVMVRAQGTIVLVNAEVERMFGYTKEELLGASIDDLVPERFRSPHASYRHGFSEDPEARAMGAGRDLYARRKDGSEFPVEIGLNPISRPDGLLILASVVDISERKHAQQVLEKQKAELERSNADLEQFAYVASHDLREPLRMVASYTSLLAERYQGQLDERADKYIRYATEGAKRMQQLISDLLDFSRVGTHAKPLAPIDTAALLDKVTHSLRGVIADNGTEIVHGALPTVMADETQLGMVFQNLIGNAVKFRSGRAPVVHVDARQEDGMWVFSVADNGIGIDKQYSGRIFQMFQRLHERGKYEGSGIGLAIVKKIVERHGGRVWFDSVPEEGTTFFFTIPAAPMDGGGYTL